MKCRTLVLALGCALLASAGCADHSHYNRRETPLPDYTKNSDRKGPPLPDNATGQKGTPLPVYTK